MVLAAGLGLRMRPLTNARPKPLVTVSGKPRNSRFICSCVRRMSRKKSGQRPVIECSLRIFDLLCDRAAHVSGASVKLSMGIANNDAPKVARSTLMHVNAGGTVSGYVVGVSSASA